MSEVLDLSHYKKETTLKGAFLNTYFLSSSFFELENFKYSFPKHCDCVAVFCVCYHSVDLNTVSLLLYSYATLGTLRTEYSLYNFQLQNLRFCLFLVVSLCIYCSCRAVQPAGAEPLESECSVSRSCKYCVSRNDTQKAKLLANLGWEIFKASMVCVLCCLTSEANKSNVSLP